MAASKKKSSQFEMTFFEHIDALRPHLVRGVVALLVIMVVAFLAKGFIVDTVLFGPMTAEFPTNRFLSHIADLTGIEDLKINTQELTMINTTMAGQFNLHLKVSMVTALVLAIPYLVWELWQFVKPALTSNERRGSQMFVFYVSSCFFIGLLFGYYIIAPLSVNFFGTYNTSEHITNMIDANSYLSNVINCSLACAILFQLPLLVYFLTRMGILSPTFMRKYRRHAIIVLAVFSAIITPPDLFSLVLVMLPIYALYELSIYISARTKRKMEEREAQEEEQFRALPSSVDAGSGDE